MKRNDGQTIFRSNVGCKQIVCTARLDSVSCARLTRGLGCGRLRPSTATALKQRHLFIPVHRQLMCDAVTGRGGCQGCELCSGGGPSSGRCGRGGGGGWWCWGCGRSGASTHSHRSAQAPWLGSRWLPGNEGGDGGSGNLHSTGSLVQPSIAAARPFSATSLFAMLS